MGALKPHKIPKADLKDVQRIFDTVEERDERVSSTSTSSGDEDPEVGPRTRAHEGRLLARLRQPRLHP